MVARRAPSSCPSPSLPLQSHVVPSLIALSFFTHPNVTSIVPAHENMACWLGGGRSSITSSGKSLVCSTASWAACRLLLLAQLPGGRAAALVNVPPVLPDQSAPSQISRRSGTMTLASRVRHRTSATIESASITRSPPAFVVTSGALGIVTQPSTPSNSNTQPTIVIMSSFRSLSPTSAPPLLQKRLVGHAVLLIGVLPQLPLPTPLIVIQSVLE